MCGVNEKFLYYTRRSRTCNTDSGIVRWTRNAASANVSFKQTSIEYHQPKKSQLPIKSNANILGLGFYPVIINKVSSGSVPTFPKFHLIKLKIERSKYI